MKTLIVTSGLAVTALLASCDGYGGLMRNGPGHMNGYGNMMNCPNGGIFMILIQGPNLGPA